MYSRGFMQHSLRFLGTLRPVPMISEPNTLALPVTVMLLPTVMFLSRQGNAGHLLLQAVNAGHWWSQSDVCQCC